VAETTIRILASWFKLTRVIRHDLDKYIFGFDRCIALAPRQVVGRFLSGQDVSAIVEFTGRATGGAQTHWLHSLTPRGAADCARGRQPRYIVEDGSVKLHLMSCGRLVKPFVLVSLGVAFGSSGICMAQDISGVQSWTASSQQGSPGEAVNPTRTNETHSEVNGRVVDRTSVETLGPDGRYVPYSDTEKESLRINDTTVRNIERAFGRDSDGHRTLIQERQEESRSLPGGEQKVTRTISNPDVNGGLQVVQRELEHSQQLRLGVRVTETTVLTPDGNGGFSAAVRTEERETKTSDGTVESRKSTLLSDGIGGWKLSEVRENTTRQEGEIRSKDERVLRPDSTGNLAVVEHTVDKQAQTGAGETRDTAETYSTNVPGVAGDSSLQLVQRETTVRRTESGGAQTSARQIEQPRPGDFSDGLHVTQEAIDIVRPGGNGTADQSRVILAPDSDGRLSQVWIDTGKTNNPSAIKVDTSASTKSQ
jgi:hypothetical protein